MDKKCKKKFIDGLKSRYNNKEKTTQK